MGIKMKPKSTVQMSLTLMSLFLVCTSSALAGNQEQYQKSIIDRMNQEQHGKGMFETLRDKWDSLQLYGEVLISEVSYKINHETDTQAVGDNITTEADLDFWNNLQAQFPFSERPVFICKDSVCEPAYEYIPEGVSEVIVMDNNGKALDSYTVTKNDRGFTIQKRIPSNPDYSYTITLNRLEELDARYGNISNVQAAKTYIKDQIQTEARS
jgi:hypothetical protein